ncbi:MAG: dGTP triphosphohydrolase [Cyanobacteria bacterium P01_H01_bin.15]
MISPPPQLTQPLARDARQHLGAGGLLKPGDHRTPFQTDRDRLLYSAAFRRLAQVTQVVGTNEGHVFHNRLTHSLKVAQVARRLAEKLVVIQSDIVDKLGGIDPDVAEAAALAHDLGHPPFGHIAEVELDECARRAGLPDGFEGNAQSFRILTQLDVHRLEYPGLNLTRATLNAVLKYPWLRDRTGNASRKWRKFSVYDLDQPALEFVRGDQPDERQTAEASIMDFADDVTYSVHDFEDFYLAGLIPLELLAHNTDEFDRFVQDWQTEHPNNTWAKQVDQERKKFQRFLDTTYNISGKYAAGSQESRAHVQRVSSYLIQKYVNSVELRTDYGSDGYLHRQPEAAAELRFLQRIVWHYVIANARLALHKYGQRRIVRTLLEFYLEAVETGQQNLLLSQYVRRYCVLQERGVQNQDISLELKRMAVDIVAGFSEMEAVQIYRRLMGITQGSVVDNF